MITNKQQNIHAILEMTLDDKIRCIRDAEWHLGCEFTRGFESMTIEEVNKIYVQRFLEIQAIYAPNAPTYQDATQKPQRPKKRNSTPPRAAPAHHKTPPIDWQALAPKTIKDVALELLRNRPIFSQSTSKIRFGNHGSFCVNIDQGTFFDHEAGEGGGLLAMIQYIEQTDKAEAVRWLKDKGFINNTFTPSHNPRPKPTTTASKTDAGYFKIGARYWKESEAIPFDENHPARQWAAHRNLIAPRLPFPLPVRFHAKHNLIVVSMTTISHFLNAYPRMPKPKQFQLIAIDSKGNKRRFSKHGKGDKRTYGTSDDCCVVYLGNPDADEVYICEGVADALSIYSRVDAAVIATATKPHKLIKPEPLDYLSQPQRSVTICGDSDAQEDVVSLVKAILKWGGTPLIPAPNAKDPAEAAALAPFPDISEHSFRGLVKANRNVNHPEPERAAWLYLVGGAM